MTSINADTFALFPSSRQGQFDDLMQSVRDRILTLLATRRFREVYGTYMRRYPTRVGLAELQQSINEALNADERVHTVRLSTKNRVLTVYVNDLLEFVLS